MITGIINLIKYSDGTIGLKNEIYIKIDTILKKIILMMHSHPLLYDRFVNLYGDNPDKFINKYIKTKLPTKYEDGEIEEQELEDDEYKK